MKIFHTSDWHLGRTLHGADLTPAFEQWADFLVDTVRSEQIDAVLICGDIYDRGVPPVTMVQLLSETLARLTESTHVILTSGNHDSASRLGFGRALMRPELSIRTDSLESGIPIPVPNAEGDLGALVYALPYLDPDIERRRLAPPIAASSIYNSDSANPDEALAADDSDSFTLAADALMSSDTATPVPEKSPLLARSHAAVMAAALSKVHADITDGVGAELLSRREMVPRIVMAHAFVMGGESSDSEQDIRIGGVDSVPTSLFDMRTAHGDALLDYIALGHLHGPQRVNRADEPLMRYSGSPIAFSFSEENQHKSGVLLTFSDNSRTPHIELIAAPVYRHLCSIRGSLEELLSSQFDEHRDDFVRAYVTDPSRPPNLFAQLKARFPHILDVRHDRPAVQVRGASERSGRLDPLDMLRDFFATNGGRHLTTAEDQLLSSLWDTHQHARQGAE
ncbi:MAG: exonuclease SbcCD subunit D C-terminal domain-containing protein [Actinomycetaceae bacterium]|nr:exonuclease SbcCD subunit D C-terminal domain-containing protein [Actinomycetaceae bacterium]MDY5854299.1 exonuclease SbcCD subunit D C-terminal domain-containing protein [Arcanobacterium sp.]